MKEGLTVEQLSGEARRQALQREDYLFSTTTMKLISGAVSLKEPAPLLCTPAGSFGVTELALKQVAEHAGMPLSYLRKLQHLNPNLLDLNINTLLLQEPKPKLVRTLDGQARAFLSNRYKRRDNHELLEALWPVFEELGGLTVGSCDLTPHRLYLKMVSPRLAGEVRVNDTVQAGLVISNSEVGYGAVSVELMIFRLVCTNGMTLGHGVARSRRYHLGAALQGTDTQNHQLVLDEMGEAADALFWDELRGAVKESLREEHFQNVLERLQEAAREPLETAPKLLTERLARRYGLGENERQAVMARLLESGDISRYGLTNAITRMSQDMTDYERASALERLAGTLLYCPPREWKGLSLN